MYSPKFDHGHYKRSMSLFACSYKHPYNPTCITCTAFSTFFGSSEHVWNRLPATLLATASDDIALYSEWLTIRNHVPKSSASKCCVAFGNSDNTL